MSDARQYIAIDLKSFYASVECVERGLDPLEARLLVADASRTEKTICLAVSPALKAFGVGGRPRLFEVIQRLREVYRETGQRVDYIIAPPRMALYVDYSARIYKVYLKYIAPEDIHTYSIDEVFIDATDYIKMYKMSAHDLAMKMIRDVLAETGITATAGIGTNLYLSKIAMDIVAKKMPPDKDGVRIAELDEMSYRRKLWDHRPLTDFWRVGRGIARKLEPYNILTMGDIARASIHHEGLFYGLFGINAETLIDHAWGWEPVTMPYIKAYRPESHSISSGQVLTEPYTFEKARTVIKEMADDTALDLTDKGLATDQVVLHVGYDVESLRDPAIASHYDGRVDTDHYGRRVPFHAHGTINLEYPTSSAAKLIKAVTALFDKHVNRELLIRRLNISVNHLVPEGSVDIKLDPYQLGLFDDNDKIIEGRRKEKIALEREHRRQQAMLRIKKVFGKNSILKGLNYGEGATQRKRNGQIGGHNA